MDEFSKVTSVRDALIISENLKITLKLWNQKIRFTESKFNSPVIPIRLLNSSWQWNTGFDLARLHEIIKMF